MTNCLSDFYVVRVKRPLKSETFRLYKHATPAINYLRRSLRYPGATAVMRGFDWPGDNKVGVTAYDI